MSIIQRLSKIALLNLFFRGAIKQDFRALSLLIGCQKGKASRRGMKSKKRPVHFDEGRFVAIATCLLNVSFEKAR